MKTEEKLADTNQQFESFLIVAARALGGGKGDATPSGAPKADPATAPRSFAELEAVMQRALG